MDESRIVKYNSARYAVTPIKTIPGHFVTAHSHVNYYIDLTTMKARISEAKSAAYYLGEQYVHSTLVDTIVCLDGTEVIGTILAENLTDSGFMSTNEHKTIYVVKPERTDGNQMLFRDNVEPMIRNKNVLILLASVTTGTTVKRALECIEYYGGTVQGVSCLFSAIKEAEGYPIHCLFTADDIPGYASYDRMNCPLCKAGKKIEALVNAFGYSAI